MTTEPTRLRFRYEWNFYYTNGRETTGEGAGSLKGPVYFTLTTGLRDYWCSNCGARLSLHTSHWADENGYARLCNKCTGGE